MTRTIAIATLLLIAGGCRDPQTATSPREEPMASDAPPIKETRDGPGRWTIRVERTLAGAAAEGTVVLSRDEPAHIRLAAARAWLAVGQELQARGDAADAISAARAGIDELGDDYARRDAINDTDLKIYVAEDLIAEGRVDNAATTLLRVVETRIALYLTRYADVVVE
jgi:hypothetical protein